jgi:hypothetical protein
VLPQCPFYFSLGTGTKQGWTHEENNNQRHRSPLVSKNPPTSVAILGADFLSWSIFSEPPPEFLVCSQRPADFRPRTSGSSQRGTANLRRPRLPLLVPQYSYHPRSFSGAPWTISTPPRTLNFLRRRQPFSSKIHLTAARIAALKYSLTCVRELQGLRTLAMRYRELKVVQLASEEKNLRPSLLPAF